MTQAFEKSETAELARLFVTMGEFMDEGHSYAETYAHAVRSTASEPLRRLFQEMLDLANLHGERSPLEIMEQRADVVPRWLFWNFTAGCIAGVPTIWILGGKTILKVCQAPGLKSVLLKAPSHIQGETFMLLFMTAISRGVEISRASVSSAEFLGITALKNFFETVAKQGARSSSPIADSAGQLSEFFSSDLVAEIRSAECAPDSFLSFSALAKTLLEK